MSADDVTLTEAEREAGGRLVREAWIEWAQEQRNPKPSWLFAWEELSEPDREVDRRIAERVAAWATAIPNAAASATGSMLLDVQRDCIAANARAESAERRLAEVEAAADRIEQAPIVSIRRIVTDLRAALAAEGDQS